MGHPATYKTFGGHWPGYPESNLKTGKMWHSKQRGESSPRGVVVTFEKEINLKRFIGKYNGLICE